MGAREADSLPYGNAKQTVKPKAERLFPFCIPVLMLFVADDHVGYQDGDHGKCKANQNSNNGNINSTRGWNKHNHHGRDQISRSRIYETRNFKYNGECGHEDHLQVFLLEKGDDGIFDMELIIGNVNFIIVDVFGIYDVISPKKDNVLCPRDNGIIPLARRHVLIENQQNEYIAGKIYDPAKDINFRK